MQGKWHAKYNHLSISKIISSQDQPIDNTEHNLRLIGRYRPIMLHTVLGARPIDNQYFSAADRVSESNSRPLSRTNNLVQQVAAGATI